MPHYLRGHVPGSYFFTVALLEERRRLLTAYIDALRAAFRSVHTQRPFRIDAIVIPPDHRHCNWTLPPDDADFSICCAGASSNRLSPAPWRAGGAVIIPKADETRMGRLATAILGAHAGIKGISMRTSTTFTSIASSMMGIARRRLAAFALPSIRALGVVPTGMGAPADVREWDLE